MYAKRRGDHLHLDRSSTSCVSLVYLPLRCLCKRLLDCALMLSAHFVTPTSSAVNPWALLARRPGPGGLVVE